MEIETPNAGDIKLESVYQKMEVWPALFVHLHSHLSVLTLFCLGVPHGCSQGRD